MGDDMEKTQQRIKEAVNTLVDDLDRNYLRDVQLQMFNCSARCCENKSTSREVMEKCVDDCNLGMKRIQAKMEEELGTLQSQLSRCSMSCYDKQVQQFGPDPQKYDEKTMVKFGQNLDKCVSACATDHINLLPQIKDRFVKFLRSNK
uniref:Protein FAM136A n=1 Tax=Ditylenchus dipsaci TaxID=166011 RepID=A0A915EHA9_9BILA